jgi:dsRNA-specific ribonuclease/signal transduction histidine kinase
LSVEQVPAIDRSFEQSLGRSLPAAFWKLVLTTRARLHEAQADGRLPTIMAVFEAYGARVLDWAQRKHALTVERTADPKRIADLHNSSTAFYALLERDWRLEPHLAGGKGQGSDREVLPARPVAQRLLAAVAIEFGIDAAVELVSGQVKETYRKISISSSDHKTSLQEETQLRFRAQPKYEMLDASGPDHAKSFTCKVAVAGWTATGQGQSKKAAENAAAAALLARIRVSVSAPAARIGRAFAPELHPIPRQQLRTLEVAEGILEYSFRQRQLLAVSLTHASFVQTLTPVEARMALSNEALASVGSSATPLLAADYYISKPDSWFQNGGEFTLSRATESAVRADFLTLIPVSRRLSELLLTAKMRQESITREMQSQVIQAVLAAILIDQDQNGWDAGCDAAHVIRGEIFKQLADWNPRDLYHTDPKAGLQEVAQAFGGAVSYELISEHGPRNEPVYRSAATLTLHGSRMRFIGTEESSKRGSEAAAAGLAIRYVLVFVDLRLERVQDLVRNPAARRLGARLLQASVATLGLGPAGWRRVVRSQLFRFKDAVSENRSTVYEWIRALDGAIAALDVDDLREELIHALMSAPRAPSRIAAVVRSQVERWRAAISTVTPDAIDAATMRTLTNEMQLMIAVCNAEVLAGAPSQPLADMVAAFRVLAYSVEAEGDLASVAVRAGTVDLVAVIAGIVGGPDDVMCRVSSAGPQIVLRQASVAARTISPDLLPFAGITIEARGADLHLFLQGETALQKDWVSRAARALGGVLEVVRDQLKQVSQLVHDVKNLLTAASTSVRLAANEPTRRFTHYAEVERALERATGLLDEASRVINASDVLSGANFPLRPFLADVLSDTMRRLPPGVALTSHIDRAEVEFEGDAFALRSAIENVIRNAIAAVGDRGELTIESVSDAKSGRVIIEVSNSARVPDHVLRDLSAGTLPRSSSHAGAGLGLASVSRIAKQHGGSFAITNRSGRAVATFELPLSLPPVSRAAEDIALQGEEGLDGN